MTKDEALKLALEALESVLANHNGAPVLPWIEARDAIKKALAAPVQELVELTHDEVEEVWERVESSDFFDCVHPFARAIEAKLREKNNG
jgi:hypothetical protein